MADDFAGALETAMAATADPAPVETTAAEATVTGADPVGMDPIVQAADAAPTDAATAAPVTPEPAKGPIPFAAHDKALQNARAKATQEAEARYTWAATIPEPHRQTVGQFYALLDREPTQAVEVLIGQIAADPQHAPKLRSLFGKLLGNRPGAAPETPRPAAGGFPEPDIEGTDEQGQRIGLYSAATLQRALAQATQTIRQELAQEYAPLKDDFRTRQVREREAAQQREVAEYANHAYARVSQYPGFTDHEQAIAAAMRADESLSVEAAYIAVVVPKLGQQGQARAATLMQDKQAAAGVRPSGASSTPPRPRTFAEGFAQVPTSAWGG